MGEYKELGEIQIPEQDTFGPFLIRPDMVNGPWIAGGAVRGWMKGNPVKSDIDVYFRTEFQFRFLMQRLSKNGFGEHFSSTNAITMKSDELDGKRKSVVQLIRKDYHETVDSILDTFDFAQCQLITDGLNVYGSPAWDNEALEVVQFKEDTILKRFVKYYAYGHSVKPGTLKEWAKKKLNYDFSDQADY